MRRFADYVPSGPIAATLLAFDENYDIDAPSTAAHLHDVANVEGLTAITVNGHASEVHACTFDEQERILAQALDEIGDRLPVINGIFTEGSHQAAAIARMADEAGASALLVFPPNLLAEDGWMRPEMALAHFSRIADATDLPLICFVYSEASRLQYPLDTIVEIAEKVPSVRAIKDWSGPIRHKKNIRVLQSLPRPVNVLSTNSAWLLSSLAMGAAGFLSGAGSVAARLQIDIWNAVRSGNIAGARDADERYTALTEVFYAPPFLDMHNRMKEALVMLGRMPRAVVRPPLMKLSDAELDAIRNALVRSGLLESR